MMPQLTFDKQDGSGGTSSIAITSQNTFSNITPPTRTGGYTFSGYYTSANGQGTKIYNADGTPAVSVSPFTEDTTLYAYWAPNTYNISVTLNGGSGVSSSTYTVSTSSQTKTIANPTRTGYQFAGWTVSCSNGSPTISGTTLTIPANCYNNITLSAKWTANTYSVKYKANGGSGSMSDSTHTYDVVNNLTSNSFTRAGYTFAGWATSANGAKVYNNSQSVSNLTTTNGATVTLYAVWRAIAITVVLDTQSTTATSTASFTQTYDATLPNISPPSRTRYTFGGYYTEPKGGGQKIYNADGTPAVTKSTFLLDTTLYAYWLWYRIAEVTGSTVNVTVVEFSNGDATFTKVMLTPATGNVISQFSFDNENWITVVRFQELIINSPIAIEVEYSANESLNSLVIKFEGLVTTNVVPIYLKTVSGAYSGLKLSGGSVSGVVVTATLGGTAYIVGDDFENLEDSDTITISTTLCQPGYAFVGWYLDDDRTTAISTATSYRVAKSVAYEHTLVAVYQPTSNNNVNLEVDNT